MINCQSLHVFEWLVVGDNHHGWWTFTVLDWLRAWWTPYQNGHRTQLDSGYCIYEHVCRERPTVCTIPTFIYRSLCSFSVLEIVIKSLTFLLQNSLPLSTCRFCGLCFDRLKIVFKILATSIALLRFRTRKWKSEKYWWNKVNTFRVGVRGEVRQTSGLKIFKANSVFRARGSCSKVLNDKKYIFNALNSGHTLSFRGSPVAQNFSTVENIFNMQWKISGQTLFFWASAKLL